MVKADYVNFINSHIDKPNSVRNVFNGSCLVLANRFAAFKRDVALQ